MASSFRTAAVVVLSILIASATAQCAPQQIFINYGDAPSQMWISWATTCASTGLVSYGTSKGSLTSTQAANVTSYKVGTYTSPSLYHALLTG